MRLIDIDDHRNCYIGMDGEYEQWNIDPNVLSEAQPSPIWHETYDDDPESFPDDDRTVLVSFENFSQPMLGQWRHDPDIGGAWYIGDTDETFIENDLFVDGWWKLPRKPEVKG